jgi:hypothetical protein
MLGSLLQQVNKIILGEYGLASLFVGLCRLETRQGVPY